MPVRAPLHSLYRLQILLCFALLLSFIACGGGSSTVMQQPPPPPNTPTITSLTPSSILLGGPAFTLTVNGSNFVSGSVVNWNGIARQTTFVSSTQLQAAITAADVANPGAVNIVVSNPGSSGSTVPSTAFAFTVTQPPPPVTPTITSLTPGVITAGGPAFNLTVDGANFLFTSSVLWNGSPRATTMVSSTELQAAITAADIANAGPVNISVSTPASGGATVKSNTFGLTITPPLPGVPTISSLSPAGTFAGSAAFTLTVNGTNYVANSSVLWNGTPRPTTFVSATQLKADIAAGDIANAGDVNISVANPISGGTINSTNFIFPVTTGFSPQLTILSPGAKIVGSADFVMTVFGKDFLPGATVLWNGSPRSTNFIASTELEAVITAADLATVGTATVTVSDPAPGGLSSNFETFQVRPHSIPQVSFTSPPAVTVGGPAFTLQAAWPVCTPLGLEPGCYVPSSVVLWNGSPRPTTFMDPGTLAAAISASDISVPGQIMIQVFTPPPGGGISNSTIFTIHPHFPPSVVDTLPSSAPAGGTGFTLTVDGANFDSNSVIKWNGSARATTFVNSGQLTTSITTADIATPGTTTVSVSNAFGQSADVIFTITHPVTLIDQLARDIVYDPVQSVLYLSVPNGATAHPNTITVANPANGAITNFVAAGTDPDKLAISDDSTFLYAGIDGTSQVQRFTLPALASDISYTLAASPTLGSSSALDLQVAPGAPHTTAVTLGNVGVGTRANLGIYIYDDATPRPVNAPGFSSGGGLYDSLAWGATAGTLFAANNETTQFDFYTFNVNASGVTLNKDFPNVFFEFITKIHFDPVSKVVFSDDGTAADPATGFLGRISTAGPMIVDGNLKAAFFIIASNAGPGTYEIRKYDLTTFTLQDHITISNVVGTPTKLIRWGANGLAFNTTVLGNPAVGKVYALSDANFVK